MATRGQIFCLLFILSMFTESVFEQNIMLKIDMQYINIEPMQSVLGMDYYLSSWTHQSQLIDYMLMSSIQWKRVVIYDKAKRRAKLFSFVKATPTTILPTPLFSRQRHSVAQSFGILLMSFLVSHNSRFCLLSRRGLIICYLDSSLIICIL